MKGLGPLTATLFAAVSGCASFEHLPKDEQAAAFCVRNVMAKSRGVRRTFVSEHFNLSARWPVVTYEYLDAAGRLGRGDIEIGPADDQLPGYRYRAVVDMTDNRPYPAQREDADAIERQCTVEVIITVT